MSKGRWTVVRLDYRVSNASGKGPVIYGFGIMEGERPFTMRVIETLLTGDYSDDWPKIGRLYQLRGDGKDGLEIRECVK